MSGACQNSDAIPLGPLLALLDVSLQRNATAAIWGNRGTDDYDGRSSRMTLTRHWHTNECPIRDVQMVVSIAIGLLDQVAASRSDRVAAAIANS